MKPVKIVSLAVACILFLSACSLPGVFEGLFFPKPDVPVEELEEVPTRAPNTDAFTVTDELGRVWHQDNGQILLNGEPVRRLTAAENSPISYIEGFLYYMTPEGFTRYSIEEDQTYPLYYDVMEVAVAGLNRIYYIRASELFSFSANETELDAALVGQLTDGYEITITENLLYIQDYTIDLLTDTVQN